MSTDVMKAIKLSQMENELLKVRRTIKKVEGIIRSPNVAWKHKETSKKLLTKLVKQQQDLIDKMTEASLL